MLIENGRVLPVFLEVEAIKVHNGAKPRNTQDGRTTFVVSALKG